MSRLPYVNMKRIDGYAYELLGELEELHGTIPNLHRVLAQSPAALGALSDARKKLRAGSLDRELAALVEVRVASAEGSTYALEHARAAARRIGVAERRIEDVDRHDSSDAFVPRERALLRFATEWLAPGGPSDGAVAGLTIHFTPGQVVEVNALIALALLTARFARVYRVEPDGSPAPAAGPGPTGCG